MSFYGGYYPEYVPVAEKRRRSLAELKKLTKKGETLSPVQPAGRKIAMTFWGMAWCDNLESYSDYENRLPRGRSYIRNGSVLDLKISRGEIRARVSGSELYTVKIQISPLLNSAWRRIKEACAGGIGTTIELLQGKLSAHVMGVITKPGHGLFPEPGEIKLECSCPDWAGLCKHVAAALYGVGTRLDEEPELLFLLRGVDHLELITAAGASAAQHAADAAKPGADALADDQIADVFGIELDAAPAPAPKTAAAKKPAKAPTKKIAKAGKKPRAKKS